MKINWTVLMILLLITCLIGISLIFRVVRILNTEITAPMHSVASDFVPPPEAESQSEAQQLMVKQQNRLKVIQLQERVNDQGNPSTLIKPDIHHSMPKRRILLPSGGSRTQ